MPLDCLNYKHVQKTLHHTLWFAFTYLVSLNHTFASPNSEGLQANLRLTSDFSSRAINVDGEHTQVSALGLDLHKVLSSEHRDIATVVFQPYVLHFSDEEQAPHFFDGDDTGLTWRIANVNIHLDERRRYNLKIGHFEIPYGLEYEIDTNGTLRQYSFPDRAIKVDWGATLNGGISRWNYELAVSRGSGNEYLERDDSYVVAGHLGQQWNRPFAVGFSFFDGRVQTAGAPIESRFIGINTSYRYGRYELLSELNYGHRGEAEDTVRSILLEGNWVNRDETIRLYVQQRERWTDFADGDTHDQQSLLGFSLQLNRLLETSGEWRRQNSENSFFLQGRVRL